MDVRVRELRSNLSHYLELVQSGQEVLVTQRGYAVARLIPAGPERAIDRLLAEGRIVPGKQARRSPLRRTKASGPVIAPDFGPGG